MSYGPSRVLEHSANETVMKWANSASCHVDHGCNIPFWGIFLHHIDLQWVFHLSFAEGWRPDSCSWGILHNCQKYSPFALYKRGWLRLRSSVAGIELSQRGW